MKRRHTERTSFLYLSSFAAIELIVVLFPRRRRFSQPLLDLFLKTFLSTSHSASAGGPYSWLRKDPLVLAIGFLGWTIPAASPSPSFGGGSLFGNLLSETSAGLAQFPTPPSIDSPFWIYLITCASESFVFCFFTFVSREKERERREEEEEERRKTRSPFPKKKNPKNFPTNPPPPPPKKKT